MLHFGISWTDERRVCVRERKRANFKRDFNRPNIHHRTMIRPDFFFEFLDDRFPISSQFETFSTEFFKQNF